MQNVEDLRIWVIDDSPCDACCERLGDARQLADSMGCRVGVLLMRGSEQQAERMIQGGADLVVLAEGGGDDHSVRVEQKIRIAQEVMLHVPPVIVFAGGDPASREWAALLAAEQSWRFVSPALLVAWQDGWIAITRLDHTGKRSCQVIVESSQPVVITMNPGVAETRSGQAERTGQWLKLKLPQATEPPTPSHTIAADPATVDIRYASRLVAGGYGLGSKAGFDLLRRFANKLGAGVAASRKAVDMGWIEHERQVGQTGKTVEPDLYIACGISGASHHLQGMAQAKHVIAINTDGDAPIMASAHLGLVADLHDVLEHSLRRLEAR